MPRMHSPSHPGQILEALYIKPHQLSITEVAGALGIARKNLYAVIKGDYAISVEMAFKLGKLFDTTPEFWLQAQLHYDLAKGYKAMKDTPATSLKGMLICKAIKHRQKLQIDYNGTTRIVEPQCYGFGTRGTELMRGYQTQPLIKDEKLYNVSAIQDLTLLESHFDKPGPHYKKNDSAMKVIICQLD